MNIIIDDADLPLLTTMITKIEKHGNKQKAQVERIEEAKSSLELLASAWKRLSAYPLDEMNPMVMRHAEMMSYFLAEAREADKEAALHLNIVQSMQEALTLFLAEKYKIDVSKEWKLDLDTRSLHYS